MSSTLTFNGLWLRNFISYGNNETFFDLSEQGSIEVIGQNLDVGGSNGAGKTILLHAICYALYNKSFNGSISLQRLINSTNSLKNTMMEVRLAFERAGDEYEIHRTRGESYAIKFYKNGEDITPGKSVTETDALIQEVIGISYELFCKTIIFSGNVQAFLELPIAQQRNQIEELFNITLLSEKAKKLKDNIKEAEQDLKIQEAVIKQQETALELHNKHVLEAENRLERWEVDRTREIRDIQSTLTTIGQIDFELEQALHDEKNSLVQTGAYLAAKLSPAKKDKQQLTSEVEKLFAEQLHLSEAKCPYCTQAFADAPQKLIELDCKIEDRATKLLAAEEIIQALSKEAQDQQTRLSEVQASIQHTNLNELLKSRENISLLKSKLESLSNAQNPHTEAFERLLAEKEIVVQYEKVDAIRKKLEHQAFLLKLLMSKDSFLRRRIINKNIPFLNDRINNYTRQLGLPHIVKFDADMSCTVSEFGRDLDAGNLSAGESKRVNIALSLAFRDVLHHLHAKTNLLLIDELDGQLDPAGIDSVVKIIKEKSRDDQLVVFVISHSQHVTGRLDRQIIIQKQNGFSSILED